VDFGRGAPWWMPTASVGGRGCSGSCCRIPARVTARRYFTRLRGLPAMSGERPALFWGIGTDLVIDNLRAAVSRGLFDPELCPKVRSFAEHYGLAILPTKPGLQDTKEDREWCEVRQKQCPQGPHLRLPARRIGSCWNGNRPWPTTDPRHTASRSTSCLKKWRSHLVALASGTVRLCSMKPAAGPSRRACQVQEPTTRRAGVLGRMSGPAGTAAGATV